MKNFHEKHSLQDVKTTTSCPNVEEYYYKEAIVDNFAAVEDQKAWAGEGQRYWLNKEFWGGPGAPIFVFIGGEGQESCSRLTDRMNVYNMAKEHNGMMMNVEHRFYGESYPTVDMSTRNLQYLTSQQALADLSRIITHVKGDLHTTASKVITVGGSYPGNMAAWFRLKYPSITHGSIASSAPLTAQTNFPEYMEVVGQSIIHFSGQSCHDAIEVAAEKVAALFGEGAGSNGWAQLDTDFKTCSPIGSEKDLSILLSDLMGNVQGTVQYNNEHSGIMNVTNICDVMTASTDSYSQFVELSALYREENGVECEDASWQDTLDGYLQPIEKDPTNAGRPWTYQTCNEFGYFQTTDSEQQPFHSWKLLGMPFYNALCFEGFDHWRSEPQVDWINQVYGSTDIQGTNIIFAAGTIDPWHALGVTNYTAPLQQESETPVYILGTAHCHDLYAPASSDPAELTQAREVEAAIVAKWLA